MEVGPRSGARPSCRAAANHAIGRCLTVTTIGGGPGAPRDRRWCILPEALSRPGGLPRLRPVPAAVSRCTQTTRVRVRREQVPASENAQSVCLSPTPRLFAKASPESPPAVGRVHLVWTRSRAGSSAAMPSWMCNPEEKAQVPLSLTTSPPTVWPAADALTGDRGLLPRATSGMRRPTASRRSSCPSPARSRPSGSRTNAKRGFAWGATGGPALKGGSVACKRQAQVGPLPL